MAWLEKRGSTYQLLVRFGGRKLKRSLHTTDATEATNLLNRVERRLRLVKQGDVELPDEADVLSFALSDGRTTTNTKSRPPLHFSELHGRYLDNLPQGSIEVTSLNTMKTHVGHLERILGKRFDVIRLAHSDLQRYINLRSRETGRRKQPISPVTIRKELTTLSGLWNWAASQGLLAGRFPNSRLRFPKTNEKPPFQTIEEIQRRIATGNLPEEESNEQWDCLYLHKAELGLLLQEVSQNARQPWLYPMVLIAAHTVRTTQ